MMLGGSTFTLVQGPGDDEGAIYIDAVLCDGRPIARLVTNESAGWIAVLRESRGLSLAADRCQFVTIDTVGDGPYLRALLKVLPSCATLADARALLKESNAEVAA